MGSPKRPQVRSAQRNAARIVAEQAGAGSSAASDLSQTASCPASTHQAPMASEDTDPSNATGSLGQERAEAPAEQTMAKAPTQQAATEATAAQETLPDAADREPYTEATSISPKKAFMDPLAERMHFLNAIKAVRAAASGQDGGYASRIPPRPQSALR